MFSKGKLWLDIKEIIKMQTVCNFWKVNYSICAIFIICAFVCLIVLICRQLNSDQSGNGAFLFTKLVFFVFKILSKTKIFIEFHLVKFFSFRSELNLNSSNGKPRVQWTPCVRVYVCTIKTKKNQLVIFFYYKCLAGL